MDLDDLPPLRRTGLLTRLIVAMALALVLGYLGYLAIAIGAFDTLTVADFVRGEQRELEPVDVRGPALRSGDRVFVLTTQAERVVPLRIGVTRRLGKPRALLHVDLWAFDAATATVAWKQRLRTYEDRGDLMHAILGLDGGTLWLFVREPLGVSAHDGAILVDGAGLEARNPPLAGKRVDEQGYVAFGGQGLQLTLTDATQWVVHGDTYAAEPREHAPTIVAGAIPPAPAPGSTERYQLRGLPIGPRWLGVLTDNEAATLQADPVVPGRDPKEPRGAMYDFLKSRHVPELLRPQPQAYRLWSARVAQVSSAPRDWPKDFPDKWGTHDEFSDYAALPESPPFLQAGLLGNGVTEQALWLREPDSVLVLHHDKLGPSGRLHVTRVAGPAGRVVWDAPLGLAELDGGLLGPTIAFVGTEPNPAHDPRNRASSAAHTKIVAVDVANGRVASYDLTAESVRANSQ
jgi:hypothetical protein